MISNSISTISDLRFKTKDVIAKAKKEPVILFHRSTPIGALLSYKEYQDIMDKLEDYYLSLKAQEYESEDKNKIKWVSHAKVKKLLSL